MLRAALVKARLLPACPAVHVAKKSEAGAEPVTVSAGGTRLGKAAVAVVFAAALGSGLGGCFIDHRDHPDPQGTTGSGGSIIPPSKDPPIAVVIDTKQGLTTKPGDGVGVFLEYDGQGIWKLWTSCDTNKSGAVCGFDLYVTADALQIQSLDNLEESDFVDIDPANNVAHVSFDTSSDTDGVTFRATPGAVLELESYLDSTSAQNFVYWVGDGQVKSGAPSNPVDFWPK